MKFLRFLIVLLLSAIAFASPHDVYKSISQYSHHIRMQTMFDKGGGCSATAVGPHVLLTASHCEVPGIAIDIDDEPAAVEVTVRDGNDHSFLFVSGIKFDQYATIKQNSLEVGDEFYILGNPGKMRNQFRKGMVSGTNNWGPFGEEYQTLDLNGFYGDSGSGLFNESGELIGVVSIIYQDTQGNKDFKVMGAFPLIFDKDQLKAMRSF